METAYYVQAKPHAVQWEALFIFGICKWAHGKYLLTENIAQSSIFSVKEEYGGKVSTSHNP